MRVAVWYNNRDIRIEEVDRPVPGPGEILVKILACGICGSDIVEWYRLPRAPLVPGHEIGGEVVATGTAVESFKPGDRVFIAPKIPCMQCDYCKRGHFPVCPHVKERLPGGFAEYIRVPAALVESGTYRLPAEVSADQSTFIEPLACVVRAQNLATVKAGQTVMIFGCGMSGLLHIKLAKAQGCQVAAVDIRPERLDYATRCGADITLNASEDVPMGLLEGNGNKAEVVILCTSAVPAVEQAWMCVDKGGRIIFFAVPDPGKKVIVPINDFWMNEISILTSYYCGPPDIEQAIQLIINDTISVDDLITHRLPLHEITKGFELVLDGIESVKVIIKPNE
ncbi:MAG: alcohol dehydrogenase catalytic domain-containing protein [Desulfobacterales bacterium]|nr:alcohol dehydrogenase catalytic domain-containing protein [Desulfobacterales bacterium]